MNATITSEVRTGRGNRSLRAVCASSCQKLLAKLATVRASIYDEARARFTGPERLVRLALNEAEALAWQTQYPQLVFPSLALEKVQSLDAWQAAQAERRRASRAWHEPQLLRARV